MFEAFVLVCLWGVPESSRSCQQLQDLRGPYATIHECEVRVAGIALDVRKNWSAVYTKGYRCHEFITTNKQHT